MIAIPRTGCEKPGNCMPPVGGAPGCSDTEQLVKLICNTATSGAYDRSSFLQAGNGHMHRDLNVLLVTIM